MASQDAVIFKETVQVLITSCGDKEESVNNAVIKSLGRLAAVNPNSVIEYFCEFYKNTAKVNPVQLANLIKVLELTCVNHMKLVQKEMAAELVGAMLRAMTQSTDYQPTVQLGASSVLVAISYVYLDMVLQSLMKEINTASVPHYTIPHTLGTLAAVNTRDIVPFIKDILGKMLPLLSLIRAEGTKQAFSYAFGHFAIAVSEQIGDNVENDNITSIKDNFVVEFSIIFDVLCNQWLHSSEAKVSESVLEALGPLTRLISERKFNEIINKFVLTLLSLYRKTNINPYYISQCISYLITPSALNPKICLNDNVINSTNHTMFNLIVLEPDYDQPHTVKNHFEVLRCFDHMSGQFPEQTIEGLLHQCKNNQEKDRMKAVIILTHLTTSSQIFIDKYSVKFINILKVMTNMEQGLKMKKLVAKAIVGLVYKNCITNMEDFAMVEFIVKHCGAKNVNGNVSDLIDLQDTCKSSLILLCNSAINVRTQMRDLLLKSLTMDDFTPSMATVCQCLLSLFQNNSEASSDEKTNLSSSNKISPDLIFVRCMTHLSEPNEVERNKNLLLFLDEYSGDIHKNLKTAWSVEVDRLVKYVSKCESKEQWHEMILDLIVAAIEQVNSNKWVENVSNYLSQQILSTKQSVMIKGVSIQLLAVMSCHMSNAAIVEQILKIILLSLKSIPVESIEYVSKAIGIASRQHGEYVLNELDAFHKDIESKRGNKLLNFISSKHSRNETELNVSKVAVIICYGKVASECLDVHILARLGEHLTVILLEILKSSPNFELCRATVTTLYEVAKALQPAAHHNVVLRNRWHLLNSVLQQIYNQNLEKRNVELYPIIVNASKALTKLQKGILPEERNTIVRVLFSNIFGELRTFNQNCEIEGKRDENDKLAKTLNDSLMLLHDLMRELIIQSPCLSTIDDLVTLLIEWLRHENDEIRTAATLIFQVVLDAYLKNVKLNYETPSKFGQMGYLLGLIVPGIADSNFSIRLTTIECIKLIIQIQYLYEGHTIEPDDVCVNELLRLHNIIMTNDVNRIAEYSMEVYNAISEAIPHNHNMQFIESLLECYDDNELRCTCVSAFLKALFNKNGQDLFQSIERIVEVFLETMQRVSEGAASKLLKALTALARHHTNSVTAVLLAQKLPLNPSVLSCWRCLGDDETISTAIVDNFLRVLNSVELFEDPYHITENHIAALQPLTLITALGEMLQEPSMSSICEARFPNLFATLYTTLACYIDAEAPAYMMSAIRGQERFGFIPNREAIRLSPAKITLHTFDVFLERTGNVLMRETCNMVSAKDSVDIERLAVVLAGAGAGTNGTSGNSGTSGNNGTSGNGVLWRVVPALCAAARDTVAPRRAAAIAMLAALLLQDCEENQIQVETIIATLNSAWKDEDDRVRATSLRGIANVAQLNSSLRKSALPIAFAALSQGVDSQKAKTPQDNVPLAAIQGLCRLLTELDTLDSQYERELLSVSQKIRPFMNTDCVLLREFSIRLFGIISSRVKSENLVEQAITCLPCFLLHLCDSSPAVVRASKSTLKQIFKTFPAPKSNDLVQNHLPEEGRLILDDFLTALLRNLAQEMPASISRCLQNAVNYLNAGKDDLKPGPALLIGKLYTELYNLRTSHPELSTIDTEVTRVSRGRLLAMSRDADAEVRCHAVGALAALCLAA